MRVLPNSMFRYLGWEDLIATAVGKMMKRMQRHEKATVKVDLSGARANQ